MELKNYNKSVSILAFVFVVCLLISVIPLLISSFYSRPLSDDFTFSLKVRHAIQSGGGFFEILSASFQQVKETYMGWQGTYSAVFIFSLQPAAFSDNLYFLTTFVMLAALILSTVYFLNSVFGLMGYDKKYGLIISCILLFLSIHFVVDKHQAFFWWNGCSYYTLFYSFSLVLYSFLIKLFVSDRNSKRVTYFLLSLLLSAIIAGGNYSTALLTAVVLAISVCAAYKFKRKKLIDYLSVFVVFMICFAVSMIAPGNSVRAACFIGVSPVKAIILSLTHSVKYIGQWTGLAQLACFALIGIIAFSLTKKTEYSFKYPFLVFVFSLLVFATQLTPPIYAMHLDGFGRQINIYYYAYYLFMTFNIFYFCGWMNSRKILSVRAKNMKMSYIVCGLLFLLCIFFCGCQNYGLDKLTFVDTTSALIEGTPQAYSEEFTKVINEIVSGKANVKDISTVPDFLCPLEFDESSYDLKTGIIVSYYSNE